MYVSLYSRKQLKQTKQFIFLASVFIMAGGAYALIREFFFQDSFRLGWAVASAVLVLTGFLWSLVGSNKFRFKDAYFSLTPERISYRLAVFSTEKVIFWSDVSSVQITRNTVWFHLDSGQNIKMRLGNIQQPEVSLHVARSIHLAALEQGVPVNGVPSSLANPVIGG
ncbi:hypothetical protein ACSX1A_13830 [Pontibacter sp. MBLB2868]|uniref:hypothetical protein n=1 Tax=Pontibacter sp. MBLB2868 TaxID=3451555 RepID=UPI003F756A7F